MKQYRFFPLMMGLVSSFFSEAINAQVTTKWQPSPEIEFIHYCGAIFSFASILYVKHEELDRALKYSRKEAETMAATFLATQGPDKEHRERVLSSLGDANRKKILSNTFDPIPDLKKCNREYAGYIARLKIDQKRYPEDAMNTLTGVFYKSIISNVYVSEEKPKK